MIIATNAPDTVMIITSMMTEKRFPDARNARIIRMLTTGRKNEYYSENTLLA